MQGLNEKMMQAIQTIPTAQEHHEIKNQPKWIARNSQTKAQTAKGQQLDPSPHPKGSSCNRPAPLNKTQTGHSDKNQQQLGDNGTPLQITQPTDYFLE